MLPASRRMRPDPHLDRRNASERTRHFAYPLRIGDHAGNPIVDDSKPRPSLGRHNFLAAPGDIPIDQPVACIIVKPCSTTITHKNGILTALWPSNCFHKT